jgi:hypothetical protein
LGQLNFRCYFSLKNWIVFLMVFDAVPVPLSQGHVMVVARAGFEINDSDWFWMKNKVETMSWGNVKFEWNLIDFEINACIGIWWLFWNILTKEMKHRNYIKMRRNDIEFNRFLISSQPLSFQSFFFSLKHWDSRWDRGFFP